MSEPVKRYALDLGTVAAGESGVKVYALHRSDPNGDFCRYEPRFDAAPQLSREEVDLIEWARAMADNSPSVLNARSKRQRLDKLGRLITRLRESPSPWVEMTPETMPVTTDYDVDRDEVWVRYKDGSIERRAIAWVRSRRSEFTHWAPIVRPEPPGAG